MLSNLLTFTPGLIIKRTKAQVQHSDSPVLHISVPELPEGINNYPWATRSSAKSVEQKILK